MKDSSQIVAEAVATIEAVERSLAAGDEALRELGLDPEKVRTAQWQLGPEQQAEVDALLRADREAIEAEVSRASFYSGKNSAPASAPRSRRSFI